MTEIDWSKAPEGAVAVIFHKCNGRSDSGKIYLKDFCVYDGEVYGTSVDNERVRALLECWELIERPSSQTWNGEALPPVGTVCEVRWGSKDWSRCTVFAHKPNANGTTDALIDLDGDWTFFDKPSMFRPIRTPEQIAAEERERAVDALCYEISMHYGYPKNAEAYRALATKLHDAGYRKTEG